MINILQSLFLRLRSFLTCLDIHGGQLLDLSGSELVINGGVTRPGPPLSMDHASSINELVFTQHLVVTMHSFMPDIFALNTFGRSFTQSYITLQALKTNDETAQSPFSNRGRIFR